MLKKSGIEEERKKVRSRVGNYHELNDTDRAVYYSSWIYSALFAATAINDGQSLDELAKIFNLSREKADQYLAFLVKTGICQFSDGKYKMGETFIFVPNESPFVVKHHTNWRIKAMQKMDSRENRELFFSSPMSISRQDFNQIREVLSQAIQKSLDICKDSPAEEVVCLNIDFFRSS